MARRAGGIQSGEDRTQVVPFEHDPVLGIEVLHVMTPGTPELAVFAFESPTGLHVIETVPRDWPPHQLVISTVMFRMTSRAVVASQAGLDLAGMVSAILSESPRYFLVAVQTLELDASLPE